MTSDQFSRALERQSFTLQKSWFGDHNWGARHSWAKKSIRDLWALTDLARAIDAKAASQLMAHRAAIVFAALLCKPTYYRWQVAHGHRSGQPWRAREVAAVACTLPLSLISTPIVRSLAALASQEWEDQSSDPTGQEMFMYFRCARCRSEGTS